MMSLIPPSSATFGAKAHWEVFSGLWQLLKELVSAWYMENMVRAHLTPISPVSLFLCCTTLH